MANQPIYTEADWSPLGNAIAGLLGRVLGQQQAQPAQAQPAIAVNPQNVALAGSPLPPARPPVVRQSTEQAVPLASTPLPPSRPADHGSQPAAQQPVAQIPPPAFDVTATSMPARPFTPTPVAPAAYTPSFDASAPPVSPASSAGAHAAPLAAAASIPVQLPPASSPATGAAALNAAASIPVNLPTPKTELNPWEPGYVIPTSEASASAAPPWSPNWTPPAPTPAVTRGPWERPSAADEEGPWTLYQRAQPSQHAPAVTRDPWERPTAADLAAEEGPWTMYQAARPATQQNGPRAWGQASNLDDPYANASLADSAAAIGRTADNAVRNAVGGMTLGYGDKIAAGLDALTGRSPDYDSALTAERAQSAQAMARSPGGVGTAEQILGMAMQPARSGGAQQSSARRRAPCPLALAGSRRRRSRKPRRPARQSAGSMRPAMTKTSRRTRF